MSPRDHGDSGDAPTVAAPLVDVEPGRRPTPAEEARTLAAATNVATLGTLTGEGDPWASLVTYGLLSDGSPVLCVSTLAEHGRNLAADGRASLSIVQPDPPADPLASARITLAGVCRRPVDDAEHAAARAAHLDAVPAAEVYIDFSDFSLWVLEVQRVRWVGGYGRMDSASAPDYAAARPDPVRPRAAGAVSHLNEDHADALLQMAQALGGFPDAERAMCIGTDRYGLDLRLHTPRGPAVVRIGYAEVLDDAGGLRAATVELARRARTALTEA